MEANEALNPLQIKDKSINRLSRIFGIAKDSIKDHYQFGVELNASFVSDFKDNELDEVLFDIQHVADKQTRKRLDKSELTIKTVKNYYEHMQMSYGERPDAVLGILGEQYNRLESANLERDLKSRKMIVVIFVVVIVAILLFNI